MTRDPSEREQTNCLPSKCQHTEVSFPLGHLQCFCLLTCLLIINSCIFFFSFCLLWNFCFTPVHYVLLHFFTCSAPPASWCPSPRGKGSRTQNQSAASKDPPDFLPDRQDQTLCRITMFAIPHKLGASRSFCDIETEHDFLHSSRRMCGQRQNTKASGKDARFKNAQTHLT